MPQVSTLKSLQAHRPPAPADDSAASHTPRFAMLSDAGRVRQSNEDACGAVPGRGIYAVCDGMGGAAAGEVASQLALETLLDSIIRRKPPPSRRNASKESASKDSSGGPGERLAQAIQAANHAVHKQSLKSRTLRGMGTTLVALLVEDDAVWLAHVGDSRCYRLRDGHLELLTQDHSLVEEQIQAGILSRLQAESSPIRNIITRAIGSQPAVEAELAVHPIQSGDLYLLASDGLTRELDDAGIEEVLRPLDVTGPLDPACRALVERANAHGGGDNITVLLVAFP